MSTISDALKKAQEKREAEKDFEGLEKPDPIPNNQISEKEVKPKKRSKTKVLLTLIIIIMLFGGTLWFNSEPAFMDNIPDMIARLKEFELPVSLFGQNESVKLTSLEEIPVPFKDANAIPAQTVRALHRTRMLSPKATGPLPTLSGIMFIMDEPRAVLNGKTRFTGDTVGGYLVKEITEEKVVLNDGKKDIPLPLE